MDVDVEILLLGREGRKLVPLLLLRLISFVLFIDTRAAVAAVAVPKEEDGIDNDDDDNGTGTGTGSNDDDVGVSTVIAVGGAMLVFE